MSLNKVMLIGNVGKDPEVRYLEGNSKVATFRLATSEKYRDRDGNMREMTEWHTVTVWRTAADLVEKYVRKGTQLYVEGRLRTRSWNDKSGNTRTVTEIAAENIQLLGRAPEPQRNAQNAETRPERPLQTDTGTETADDDLPF